MRTSHVSSDRNVELAPSSHRPYLHHKHHSNDRQPSTRGKHTTAFAHPQHQRPSSLLNSIKLTTTAGNMFRSSSLDNGRPGNARTASRAVAAGPAAAIEAAAEQSTQIGPLVRLTLPALVINIGQTALLFTSYTYTGQLSDAVALAGLGLGISFCNITGA